MDILIDNEFRDLIPPLSDDERKQLEENILHDGIRDPLVVWNGHGIIVDGHNRFSIAQKHGLTFKTTELQFADRNEAKIWIIQNQLGRRNLSAYDRSILALKLKPVIAAKAKERMEAGTNQYTSPVKNSLQGSDEQQPLQETPKPAREQKTNFQVAQAAGVSEDTIRKVEKIEAQASPEIKAALRTGDMSINQAFKAVKNAEKTQRQEETRERKAYTSPTELPTDKFKLIRADIRDGLAEIEDNSVDFIITDPPYPKEFLPLYEDLSKVAARVLKDGGSLICMTGQSYLPDVIQLLSTEIRYHWCLCYLTPGGQSAQLFQRRVNTFWKPLLWFVKGNYSGDWTGDVLKSPVNDNDKRFHEWGQSFAGVKDIVERLTNPNDVILDPFLGGGTTGVVSVTCGRKFIGVDVEQSCIDTTLNRLREVFEVAPSQAREDGLAG